MYIKQFLLKNKYNIYNVKKHEKKNRNIMHTDKFIFISFINLYMYIYI